MRADQNQFINAQDEVMITKDMTVADAIKASVDYYYKSLVSAKDQKLLDLAFNSNISQEDLDKFLSDWDIEAAGSAKALLLSYVMKSHPELKFNEYTGPRLKGVFNFFRFSNLTLLSNYTKIGHELNKNGIIPMIIKGGVMKYLRPELSRTMGDIDILVFGEDEYEKSKKIALDLGYEYEDNGHSIDLHTPGKQDGICDIHQYIDVESEYDKNFLRKFKDRAIKKTVFGVETYVPCPEDIFFINMLNMIKNIHKNTSVHGILYALFDFEYLKNSKPDFNWDIVLDNICATNAHLQTIIAVEFANRLVPGILPEFLAKNKTSLNYVQQCFDHDRYYSIYVHEVRAKSAKTKLHDVHSVRDFLRYLNIKAKKQVRWFVLQHPALIKIWLKLA